MRIEEKKTEYTESGAWRVVTKYLWLPKFLDNADGTKQITHWLEKAMWEQHCVFGVWFDNRWLDV
jgi:hypothetical protein